MRRRELLAGALGTAVVVTGGAVAVGGVPGTRGSLLDTDRSSDPNGTEREPIEVETIDAQGSQAGMVPVPDSERVTFVEFFATWCSTCKSMMPDLLEAAGRVPDSVRFMSVTIEPVGDELPEADLREWWHDHGGDWTLGIDPVSELSVRYNGIPVPTSIAIDSTGVVQWDHTGRTDAQTILEGIETAIAADDRIDGEIDFDGLE